MSGTRVRLSVNGESVVGVNNAVLFFRPRDPRAYEIRAEVLPTYQRPVEIEADDVVNAIVAAIKQAPDSFVAAGQWITAVTNAATQAIREEDKP